LRTTTDIPGRPLLSAFVTLPEILTWAESSRQNNCSSAKSKMYLHFAKCGMSFSPIAIFLKFGIEMYQYFFVLPAAICLTVVFLRKFPDIFKALLHH